MCALHCAACDPAGSGWGAHRSSAWLPLLCRSKRDTSWLFLLQQGEPAALDLEKLVSTVAAQKLVLETLAGKVSSPRKPCVPLKLCPPAERPQGQGAFCWPWLLLPGMGSILSPAGPGLGCWHGALSIIYLADMRVSESAEAAAAPSPLRSEVSLRSHRSVRDAPTAAAMVRGEGVPSCDPGTCHGAGQRVPRQEPGCGRVMGTQAVGG